MYIINLNSISWLHPSKRHQLSAWSVCCGNSAGPASPWFLWAARSCFVALEARSFLPMLHSRLLGAQGRWHRFVYPWMLLWEERASALQNFPLGRNLGRGKEGYICVILLFLSFKIFEKILLSLKSNNNKKPKHFSTLLLIIVSRHK